MSIVLLFVLVFIISAIGSAPPGLINLMVMKRAIAAGREAGFFAALGTVVPEFVYTYIAVYGYLAIANDETIGHHIQLVGVVVFFSLSVYYFIQKAEDPVLDAVSSQKDKFISFRRGFFTASINLLVMPFWAFITLFLHTYGYEFQTQSELITFALASALGALMMFFLYARLGHLIVYRMEKLVQYTNKFLSLIFLVLGLYQLVRLF
ncbi:MAG: LysE family translocator [Lewinella sp.]|jgi:threonine/homoserine/homoserine lactone efflux protein|uniref:LysE family translocator n=1 Tax=Lewinella sp. TaxID=2004506 RepID=UPI003D6C1D43